MFKMFDWIFNSLTLNVSLGGGGGSTSSSTTYVERALTEEELELLRSAKTSADANTRIAEEAEGRSAEQYDRYKEVFQKAEDSYITEVNDAEFGTPHERTLRMLQAGAAEAAAQGEGNAQRSSTREMSARGISANSAVSVAASTAISNQAQQIGAAGQNEAMMKAIQYGDTLKQNRLGNLGSVVGMGSQSFGGASQYQGNAMQGNNSSASINNQTFDSWNKRFQQNSESKGSNWQANFGIFA